MPKVRERSRIVQDFAVTPWQSRRARISEPVHVALYSVVEADLLAPRQPLAPGFPQKSYGSDIKPFVQCHEPDDDNPGWFTKVPRRQDPGDDGAELRRLEAAGSAASEPSAAFSQPEDEGSEDVDIGECVGITSGRALRPFTLTGPCQLGINPAGYGMGHIFVATTPVAAATNTSNLSARRPEFPSPSRSSARCYGLAVRPVPAEVPPDPCFEDDGTQLLRAQLTNFVNGATVELVVARTGGDMCRLGPPPDWLLRRVLGDLAGSDAESEEEEGSEEASEREEEADSPAEHENAEGEGWEDTGSENTGPSMGPTCGPRGSRTGRSRRRRRPPGCELQFEAETLLSGAAAVPKLREFARPLLLQGYPLQEAAGEEGRSGVGGEDGGGRSVGGGGAEGRGRGEEQEAVEAVVCIGSATLRGLPASFFSSS